MLFITNNKMRKFGTRNFEKSYFFIASKSLNQPKKWRKKQAYDVHKEPEGLKPM